MKMWLVYENGEIYPYFTEEKARETMSEDALIQEIDDVNLAKIDEIFN